MSQSSDGSLVSQTLRGETEAYGELVRRYQQSVFNICYRMMAERRDAEDLTQESFMRAYQRLTSFDINRPFGPWIRRVATNVCLNFIKAQKPEHQDLDDEKVLEGGQAGYKTIEEAQQLAQERSDMRKLILKLPSNYRAVIELRHFQGMRYQEIASQLKIPVSDVKSHLFRARKQLAKRIMKDE